MIGYLLIFCFNLKSVPFFKYRNVITFFRAYRETYRLVRCSPAITEEEFSFSETHVFGRFDSFCDRIRKILTMFELIQDYKSLFERRMEGLLLGEGTSFFIHIFPLLLSLIYLNYLSYFNSIRRCNKNF